MSRKIINTIALVLFMVGNIMAGVGGDRHDEALRPFTHYTCDFTQEAVWLRASYNRRPIRSYHFVGVESGERYDFPRWGETALKASCSEPREVTPSAEAQAVADAEKASAFRGIGLLLLSLALFGFGLVWEKEAERRAERRAEEELEAEREAWRAEREAREAEKEAERERSRRANREREARKAQRRALMGG